MTALDGQELKYSYKFTMAARKAGGLRDDKPLSAEVQAYINDLLGVSKEKSQEK